MRHRLRWGVASVALAATVWCPAVAWAQDPPAKGRTVLLATLSARTSVDGTLASEADTAGAAMNGDAQASLAYRPVVKRLSVQLGGTTGLRYLGSRHELLPIGHTLGGSAGMSLDKRTTVRAVGKIGYIPTFSLMGEPSIPIEQLMEDPGLLPSVTIDYSLVKRIMHTSDASMAIARTLTQGTTLSFGAGVARTRFNDPVEPSMDSLSLSARVTQRLTRYVSFHAGYVRREATVRQAVASVAPPSGVESAAMAEAAAAAPVAPLTRTPAVVEDVDLGLDFSQGRGIRLSRRTSLNFTTGSSLAQLNDGPRRLRATGNVVLAYTDPRAGGASLNYARVVSLVPGVSRPVFSDAVSVGGNRNLGRRVALSALANYSLGSAGGTGAAADRIASLHGRAQGSYTFSPTGRFTLDYRVVRVRLGAGVGAVSGLPSYQFRHSVRATVTYQLPLVRDLSRPGR